MQALGEVYQHAEQQESDAIQHGLEVYRSTMTQHDAQAQQDEQKAVQVPQLLPDLVVASFSARTHLELIVVAFRNGPKRKPKVNKI